LPFAHTLLHSIKKFSTEAILHVLITDDTLREDAGSLRFYNISSLNDDKAVSIINKYRHQNDYLRWALKPAFLLHLLNNHSPVIYLDNDIYFFQPYHFLFEQLNHHSMLLTPHWGSYDPLQHEESFKTNYRIGLFNAGFIGVTERAKPTLLWWAELCLYNMSGATGDGFFVDQRYLDMSLIVDEHVGIVRHLGCNVGSWNMHQNKRTSKDGTVLIKDVYPVVFIHFNGETAKHIANGNDYLLQPFYEDYMEALRLCGADLQNHQEKIRLEKNNLLVAVKRKLKLRTRLKNLLFKIARKL
jgi:hypothetical protein